MTRPPSIRRIACDVGVIGCVSIPILCLYLVGKATKRGFFCDDESLRHPYFDSTVPSYFLYIFGIGLNVVAYTLVEWSRVRKREGPGMKLNYKEILWNIYLALSVFLFGAVCSQLTTDVAKYCVGRLRPHFYNLCLPVFDGGKTCETVAANFHQYVEHFTCSNQLTMTPRKMKEMGLSFPSGHSSFSMYTMVYLALYLQKRLRADGDFKLLKHAIQFFSILLAIFVGMTRIFDYKHHWSDVLAGFSIGAVSAIIVNILYGPTVRKGYNEIPGVSQMLCVSPSVDDEYEDGGAQPLQTTELSQINNGNGPA